MSASEKLKALLGEYERLVATLDAANLGPASLIRVRLDNAWPQMLAVVEWAEKFSDFTDYHCWTNQENPRLEPELDAALAALEEALG